MPRRRRYLGADRYEPYIGPSGPEFAPQWALRTLEAEIDGGRGEDECRLCACTESSACEGGCSWVEGDLCSSCEELMEAFPILRLADGYGIGVSWVVWRKEAAHVL